MGKLRVSLVIIGVFIVAFAVGQSWKLKPETAANRVVRSGEAAILQSGGPPVWICVRKEDSYRMQQAMTAGDLLFLQGAARDGSAFPADAGTRVKVLAASVDKRRIQIEEGPQAGKSGWVEFEYLRPAKPYER